MPCRGARAWENYVGPGNVVAGPNTHTHIQKTHTKRQHESLRIHWTLTEVRLQHCNCTCAATCTCTAAVAGCLQPIIMHPPTHSLQQLPLVSWQCNSLIQRSYEGLSWIATSMCALQSQGPARLDQGQAQRSVGLRRRGPLAKMPCMRVCVADWGTSMQPCSIKLVEAACTRRCKLKLNNWQG
jgi:hypothetical protein